MYCFAALLPILLAVVLMIKFRFPPGKALPLSLLLTAVIAFFLWKMNPALIGAAALFGVLKSLDIILIITGAILLLNVLKTGGAVPAINNTFAHISEDRRIQAVIIAWIFSNFIEGAAGFGAAPALAAPLLAGLGFPVMPALVVSLVCNSLSVPFGGAGIPILTIRSMLAPDIVNTGMTPEAFGKEMLSALTTVSAVSGVLIPFIGVSFMILLSGDKRKWKSILEIFPFALFGGLAFVVPWKLTAVYLGPELPNILGSAVALPVLLLVLKSGILTPKHVWDFPGNEGRERQTVCTDSGMPRWKAWLPYTLIAVLLVLTRLDILPFKDMLNSVFRIQLPEIGGFEGTAFHWAVLNNPGVFPFLVISLISAGFLGIRKQDFLAVLKNSEKQIRYPAIAIAASFAMVQIMVFSGTNSTGRPDMLTEIARTAAGTLGRGFFLASPVLGVFGTFFTGSCTVSNILFGSIQFNTARLLGMPETLLTALQNAGGGLGSMIRIAGLVAACATVNASGKEGKLLLLNCIPCAIMVLLTILAAWCLYLL